MRLKQIQKSIFYNFLTINANTSPLTMKKVSLFILFTQLSFGLFSQTNFTASATYTIPSGVTAIKVECWGAGGGGGSRTTTGRGGGGGGGAYASSIIAVSPTTVCTINVGTGGNAGASGGASSFIMNGLTLVSAIGGSGVASNTTTGATGGLATSSVGSIKFNGGNGGTANTTISGSGGGGAGNIENGSAGSPTTSGGAGGAGNPGTVTNSEGRGGAGRNSNGAGNTGFTYGGGGAGAFRSSGTQNGGAGAGGYVRITPVSDCNPPFTGTIINTTCPNTSTGSITLNTNKESEINFTRNDNDYIDLNKNILNNVSGFTLECWVKFNAADQTSRISLLGQNDNIEFGFISTNTLQVWTSNGGSLDGNITSYSITNNTWHHIAATGTASTSGSYLTLYLDGVAVATSASIGNFTNYATSTYTTKIGAGVFDASGGNFNGTMKRAGFWGRALSANEIFSLATDFHDYTSSDTGLLAGYNFNEGNGITVSSIPSNTNPGTFVNSPEWLNTPTYNWTKTGDVSFVRTTQNISGLSTGEYNITATSCNSKTQSFIVGYTTNCVDYWIGATDTDWSKAQNWSQNIIPATGQNIEFSTLANNGAATQNNLVLDQNRVVGKLKNFSLKQLIIPAGKTLIVNDSLKTSSANTNSILIKASPSAPNGSLIFKQPSLNTAVPATVEMYAKGYKGTPVTWTDDLFPTYPLSNTYTTSYRWQYFGIPVQSIVANPTFYGSYVREYKETTNGGTNYQKWTDLNNSSILTPFKGYEITQDAVKTISFSGNLVVGDKTLTLTVSGGYGSGYNIFSNSYTAAIDISKIEFPASGVEKTVYLYNTGTFADWGKGNAAGSYTAIPYNATSIIGNEIPSMQGFMLKASANNATVTLRYSNTNNSLTANTTQQRVKSENIATTTSDNIETANTPIPSISPSFIKIEVRSDSAYDASWIVEEASATRAFDNGWDGYKLINSRGMFIYSDEEDGSFQVNTVSNIDHVYLGFKAGNDINYTMTLKLKDILFKYNNLYLNDIKTNTQIKLDRGEVTYNFTANNTASIEKRFLISGERKEADKINYFRTINENGKLTVRNEGNQGGTIYVCDVIGKTIATAYCTAYGTVSIPKKLQQGTYIIKVVTDNNHTHGQKVIVN